MGRRENEHTRTDIGNGDLSGRAGRGPGAKLSGESGCGERAGDRRTPIEVHRECADEMPADKYSYHPTPEQWTFGKIVSHVAQSDFNLCSILSDTPVPQNWKVTDTDPKEKLVPAVKASLDFCSQALASLQDSKLGDTVKFFGGRQVPRARALIELTDDLEDHYSQLASYLRLNGMVPPSVKPAK
jgi:uncharacterized damage-inducible protein DinB